MLGGARHKVEDLPPPQAPRQLNYHLFYLESPDM